jgi:hypothetical protein
VGLPTLLWLALAENRVAKLCALALEISVRVPKGVTRESVDAMLYNEAGLPKEGGCR